MIRNPKEEAEILISFFKSYAFFDTRLDIINYKRSVTYNSKLMSEFMVKTIINELEGIEESKDRILFYYKVLDEINIYE